MASRTVSPETSSKRKSMKGMLTESSHPPARGTTPSQQASPSYARFNTPTKRRMDVPEHPSTAHSSGSGGDGGIKITKEDVESAFSFFDVSGRGVLRPKDLKARLGAFYPNMTNKEYRFLISEPNFTVDTLWNLLENNNIMNFDPVKEAFKVYDPHDTGYVDSEVLKGIMARMGYGEMTSEDMEVLIKTADADGDGKISLEDFKTMLRANKYNSRGGHGLGGPGRSAFPPPPAGGGVSSGDEYDSPVSDDDA